MLKHGTTMAIAAQTWIRFEHTRCIPYCSDRRPSKAERPARQPASSSRLVSNATRSKLIGMARRCRAARSSSATSQAGSQDPITASAAAAGERKAARAKAPHRGAASSQAPAKGQAVSRAATKPLASWCCERPRAAKSTNTATSPAAAAASQRGGNSAPPRVARSVQNPFVYHLPHRGPSGIAHTWAALQYTGGVARGRARSGKSAALAIHKISHRQRYAEVG